jgi:LysR family transcriptional regulator, low CO2-responsive transcriptional regulator
MFTLDLYKLEIFVAVAEAGSLSKAAERLHMTQPGVSQHIQALEDSLGAQLFLRGRRGVRLTEPGETLLRYTRSIFALVAEAEHAVMDVKGLRQGRLRIGATPGVSAYLLPDWVQAFRQHYPALSVQLQTDITPRIIPDLRARRLDVAVIEGELDAVARAGLQIQELEEVDQLVIVGPQHPWWELREVPIEALARQPFVMRQGGSQTRIWLDQALREHAISPLVVAEFDNLESIKRMVALGANITILPAYAVAEEQARGVLRAIAIVGHPLRRTLKLIWSGSAPPSPIVSAFLAQLGGVFPPLTPRS